MSERTIRLANQFYKDGNLVPIIGAGCSMPFGSPGWDVLIQEIATESIENKALIEAVNHYVNIHDYWGAIKSIKDFGNLNEDDIKQDVANKIGCIKMDETVDNNLVDLASMDFDIYLTTNYDHFLSKCIKSQSVPICLSDVDFNTQTLFESKSKTNKSIYHLHGHISNPGTIVISRESYEILYADEKYKKMFNLLGASKAFLFIGMSFDDQFMRLLLEKHVDVFKSKSFILLDKAQNRKFKELKEKYNVEIIEYDSSTDGHIIAIRNVLEEISKRPVDIKELGKDNNEVIGAILDKEKISKVEENLFFEKLKLEDIEELTVELCKLYFIAAEEYVAALKKHVISKEIIRKVLFVVFTKHKELFISEYQKSKSSQSFLKKVHEVLKETDFSRFIANLSNEQIMIDIEQQGLIHILADDPDEEIWWGNKRFNGDEQNE